ncbi:uncharacterized protein N7477_000985 [Penicillium maclennaniae]|uniref:uncharacterized protein n=1 Tax=Penicillium maclennaniae TaxID=1343394 RepID=UPI00253F972A|nr:uncharacterized protein N7477_000985 [Penicillium maclennaniae]KAJ5684640.1 hypothetical protein N7477_000985 [Penicillium maclennaniae]
MTIFAGDNDAIQLQRLGKRPVLKDLKDYGADPGSYQRNSGVLSILGLSCTILATWEGLLE